MRPQDRRGGLSPHANMPEPHLDSKLAEIAQACEPEAADVPPLTEPPTRGMFRALRHRDYRLFWTGNFLSNIGTWMQNLAQGWLVLQITNSVFLLGLVGFTSSFPTLAFTLIGGVIADRANRRHMLMLMQAVLMVMAFLLSALTFLQVVTVHQILVISFVSGLATALSAPAYQALVPELVPASDLTNAIAMNSAQFNLSRLLGPLFAGLALAQIGSAGCFFLNAVSFLALLYALQQLRLGLPPHDPGEGFWQPLADGFRYIHRQRIMRTLMGLVALASLCAMPYVTLMPAFARDVLHLGPEGLGYLMGAAGAGALTGALLLARFGDSPRKGARLVRGFLILYSALIVFTLSRHPALSLVALFVAGAAVVTAVPTVNNLLQVYVAPEMRGRVMSMHATAFLGFAPIGSLISGALAHYLGAPGALATLCAAALVATLLVRLRMPEISELS